MYVECVAETEILFPSKSEILCILARQSKRIQVQKFRHVSLKFMYRYIHKFKEIDIYIYIYIQKKFQTEYVCFIEQICKSSFDVNNISVS